MNLQYLEIGTSDFDTIVQKSNDVGMSVEPIKYYLDRLPSKENNIKVNCAISTDGQEGQVEVYYVPAEVIHANKWPNWLRGCNSVNDYHLQHRNLNIEKHVKKELVPLLSISSLIKNYNIESIEYLKTDTEGQDCGILKCFFECIKNNTTLQPNKILFESNILSVENDIIEIVELYSNIGYKVTRNGTDTTMIK